MSQEIYRKLRQQLDQYSVGYPQTRSGVELRILEHLFTEEEAELYLQMSLMTETPESVAQRLGRDQEQTAALLERMAKKGLLFFVQGDGTVKYGAAAFVLGIYEYQLNRMDRHFAQMFEDYIDEGYIKHLLKTKPVLLKPIPIHRSVRISQPVALYEASREIVKNQKIIAVSDCVCQKQQALIDQGCERPKEVCLSFGLTAQHHIHAGMGREITTEEAIAILDRCEEAGMVSQASFAKQAVAICNCCPDCCPILRVLKREPHPSQLSSSNFYAVVNPEECMACDTCLDRCPMEAITITPDQTALVDRNRCIGCGLCVTTCPSGALVLKPKPEEERQTPPESPQELLLEVARNRGKSLKPLFMTHG